MARRRTTLLLIEVAHFYLALRMAITSEFVSNSASSSYVLQIGDVVHCGSSVSGELDFFLPRPLCCKLTEANVV